MKSLKIVSHSSKSTVALESGLQISIDIVLTAVGVIDTMHHLKITSTKTFCFIDLL